MTQLITGTFAGTEGQLYWQAWRPAGEPHSVLVIAHGFDDHLSRYTHVAEYFAAHGHAVYAFDQIGHGKSAGQRGHVLRFDHYVEDLKQFVAIAQTREEDLQTFVIGHSQGGLIALRYGIQYPQGISGIIASGSALIVAMPVPAWKLQMGKVMSNLAPSFSMPNDIPLRHLSHDQVVVAARRQDALRHGKASARWADEFFTAQADTLANAARFNLPCLLLHGGNDKIISPESTQRFYAAISSTDKTIKIYDGMYHEIFNELGKEEVLTDVEQWIEERLATPYRPA